MTEVVFGIGFGISLVIFVFGFGAVGSGASQGMPQGRWMVRCGLYLLLIACLLAATLSVLIGYELGSSRT